MLDAATFRAIMPEFADVAAFPDARVGFWLASSLARLPEDRWGGLWAQGVALLTAHQLYLSRRRIGAMAGSGGGSLAPVSSKSVGAVSVAYDNSLGAIEGAGAWNLSPYGVEFWQLCQLVGMGGTQL